MKVKKEAAIGDGTREGKRTGDDWKKAQQVGKCQKKRVLNGRL